ncbi:MAG TPA: type II secretion system protein [Vicinamibacterales bacterium]|jgi:type II secretory pathway pseudopilin PulG
MAVMKTASRGESGFTLIDLLFTASLICTLCTMALPSLYRARGAAQSASAVSTLRVVNSAQISFAVACGSGFYSPDFQTLGIAPVGAVNAFLPADLATGASFLKQGYTFGMTGAALAGAPATCNGQAPGYSATGYAVWADPLDPQGNPYFYGSNADGAIYQHTATFNGMMPESGRPSIGTPLKTN